MGGVSEQVVGGVLGDQEDEGSGQGVGVGPETAEPFLDAAEMKHISKCLMTNHVQYIVGLMSKARIFDFYIFQERQKTEQLLLGVSYIAES